MCHGEQLRALDKGKRLIPVLAERGADRTTYVYAVQLRDFTNDGNYAVRLSELLADIRGDATATLPDTYRKTRVTYLTAPPRVANYLERPEALHALRDALFAEDNRQSIALTALHGMGGIGKTVLAKALTDDEVVQRAFPDGIVWITVGKERKGDFIADMREVAKALGDDLSGYDSAMACANQYRTTIRNKAALIVVDDVWSKADIEPLLADSPRSRFLFTTRNAAIGRFVAAREHRADLMDLQQSRELLGTWADVPVRDLPPVAETVIAECGRLPLALSVVGAMLRGTSKRFWTDTVELLRNADLSAIEDQLPEGQQSFFRAVEVSFQTLKPDTQSRYRALAVLLEDMEAPLPVLQTLWNVEEAEARRVIRHLADRSLALVDKGERIHLHDLQLDYVRAHYPDKEALEIIRESIRLSSTVISNDPWQFPSQIVGRLLPHQAMPAIAEFIQRVSGCLRFNWLRPMQPGLHPPGTGVIRTLTGHSGHVNAVVVTKDGQRAVSASNDHTLKVWDLGSWHELRTICCHQDEVSAVTVTPDGLRAVSSSSSDRALKVWDLVSGRQMRTLSGHSGYVKGVAVTPDGETAVSASDDKTLKVWDLAIGCELRALVGHLSAVEAVALTPDGKQVVSASEDHTLKIWDLASGRELRTLHLNAARAKALAVTPDGLRVVSASDDRNVKVQELVSGRELQTFSGHSDGVTSVAVTPDGCQAISASLDKTLKVWDLATGCELRTLTGHYSGVKSVAITPDGRRVLSASDDETLKVWDLATRRELRGVPVHSGRVTAVAITPDGRRVLSASDDWTVKVWDVGCEELITADTLRGHTSQIMGVAITGDGRRAVSASWDGMVKVWDVASRRELRTLAGHKSFVNAVALTKDGRRAVSASSDKTVKVWDVLGGREARTFTAHSSEVTAVSLTADDERVLSASRGELKVWELESGRELMAITGHSHWIRVAAVMANGDQAIVASWDNVLQVWEMAGGREMNTLRGHASAVLSVAAAQSGKRAVSASYDKTLKVWDLETGTCLATFSCDSAVRCCASSNGLELIVAGDEGGHVHFLRLEEPKAKG